MYRTFLFCILCLTAVSCATSRLAVYTDYLSRENLASYQVGTIDPLLNYPPLGQRLIVIWTLKKKQFEYSDLHLKISIRFKNRKETVVNHYLTTPKGTFIYSLLGEDYLKTDGILTFKVELIGNSCILDEWRHQIWTNLITLNDKDTPNEDLPEKSETASISNHVQENPDVDLEFCD